MSYHEEQESLENLKAWWTRWGNAVTWAVLVVLVAFAAYNGWNYWQRRQTASAAVLYDEFQQAAGDTHSADAKARVLRIASDMEKTFGRTPYAPMTALQAAATLYAAGDSNSAKAQLQWTIDHASDEAMRRIAQIRLAGLLLDEKAYDAGLALLSDTPAAPFAALWSDRRGDLLAAQGKAANARQAYQAALGALGSSDPATRQLVQFKLDALGGAAQ